MVSGTPEDVVAERRSYSGRILAEFLERRRRWGRERRRSGRELMPSKRHCAP